MTKKIMPASLSAAPRPAAERAHRAEQQAPAEGIGPALAALPAGVLASIAAVVDYNWADEERDYKEQDPADRAGHIFVHLERIGAYLAFHRSA